MSDRAGILAEAMTSTSTSQTALSRLSGVYQPSISQFLHGKIDMSDEMLAKLLGCMGLELKVTRSTQPAPLNRSEWRSWKLHHAIALRLNSDSIAQWQPRLTKNVHQLRSATQGQPHERNLATWAKLVAELEAQSIRKILTGIDRESIEMREVSPFSGILSDEDRRAALELETA